LFNHLVGITQVSGHALAVVDHGWSLHGLAAGFNPQALYPP
jgi:hypothetical protein